MLGRNDKKNMKTKRIPVLIVVSILLVVFIIFRGAVGSLFGIFQSPLASFGTVINSTLSNFFASKTITEDELASLFEERKSLAVDKVVFEKLVKENKELKELLQYKGRESGSIITASILARSLSDTSSTFIINRGEKDGLIGGEPIIVGNGFFVGKITNVGEASSVVTAVTDPNIATSISLLNETRTIGIAEGVTGNLIKVKFIPDEENVNVNDLVVTSGLESRVPAGLIVGIVNIVRPDPNAPFQEAVLEPLVDMKQFSNVIIRLHEL